MVYHFVLAVSSFLIWHTSGKPTTWFPLVGLVECLSSLATSFPSMLPSLFESFSEDFENLPKRTFSKTLKYHGIYVSHYVFDLELHLYIDYRHTLYKESYPLFSMSSSKKPCQLDHFRTKVHHFPRPKSWFLIQLIPYGSAR